MFQLAFNILENDLKLLYYSCVLQMRVLEAWGELLRSFSLRFTLRGEK